MNIKSDKIKLLIYKKWKTDLKWFRNILPTKLKTKKNTLIEKPRMCEFWFQKKLCRSYWFCYEQSTCLDL